MENKGWKHKLVGGQKKLDLNKNGKLDAEDFKMLRSDKMATGGEVEPLGWKHKDAVEYGKKLVNKGAKTIEIRNKIEENYSGLKSEIQSIMDDVLDYKDTKMAEGGGVGDFDSDYWLQYNIEGGTNQTPNYFYKKSTDFEDTFEEAIDEWNSEAEGAENRIKGKEVQYIKNTAKKFFEKEKWISINIIQAMIAQEAGSKYAKGGGVEELKWVKRGDMYFANGKNKYDIVKGLNSYTLNVNGKVKSKGGLKVMKAYAIDLEKNKMQTGGTADSSISNDAIIGGTMASSMAKGGGVEEGATIRIEETPYMASFSDLYGKDLVIKDIKNVYFASGPQKYFIVEVDGEEYEVPERFVKKYEDGGMMETGGGVENGVMLRDGSYFISVYGSNKTPEEELEQVQKNLEEAHKKGYYSTMSAYEDRIKKLERIVAMNKTDAQYEQIIGNLQKNINKRKDLIAKEKSKRIIKQLNLDNESSQRKMDFWKSIVEKGDKRKMKKGGSTPTQRKKVAKVMHEWKEGKLHSGSKKGPIVEDQKQAAAIALSEAGLSKKEEGGELKGWKHKNK